MSKTISRGKMFSATVAVNDDVLALMKKTPDLMEEATRAGAMYWHTGILPEHFKTGASQRYGYAPRSITYLKQKKGKPPLVFSGSLRRDLTSAATFKTGARGSVELKMFARVLNFAPSMPQNSADLYIKHKNGRGYPNLKREIKAITLEEREQVAAVVAGHFQKEYEKAQAGSAAA